MKSASRTTDMISTKHALTEAFHQTGDPNATSNGRIQNKLMQKWLSDLTGWSRATVDVRTVVPGKFQEAKWARARGNAVRNSGAWSGYGVAESDRALPDVDTHVEGLRRERAGATAVERGKGRRNAAAASGSHWGRAALHERQRSTGFLRVLSTLTLMSL